MKGLVQNSNELEHGEYAVASMTLPNPCLCQWNPRRNSHGPLDWTDIFRTQTLYSNEILWKIGAVEVVNGYSHGYIYPPLN